jgi:hypothetical protein
MVMTNNNTQPSDEASQILADLSRLSEYSAAMLQSENIRPETLYTRKAYVYGQFIFSVSLMDGVITLAQQGQARAMVPLVRALWEGWLGVAFAYAGNSHVWVYYLQLQEEMTNLKKRNKLFADGKIEDEARYKDRNKEAKKIISAVKRRYKELPIVPGVIAAGNQGLERTIKLRQKCEIIDYYDSLRPKHKPATTTLVEWYDSAYSHMSGTAHVSVTELNALFKYDAAGRLHVDISGGSDRKYLASLLLITYLYHYLLMKVFIGNISVSGQRIPDDIKAARRRMTASRFRKA